MVNLLTNYIDRTQKRLYRYRRSKQEIVVFSKEFYLNVLVARQCKVLLDKEVQIVNPFYVKEVSTQDIPDVSFTVNRQKNTVTELNLLSEKITVVGVTASVGMVVLTDKVVNAVVLDSVETALSRITDATVMAEDEEEECDEDFEFI